MELSFLLNMYYENYMDNCDEKKCKEKEFFIELDEVSKIIESLYKSKTIDYDTYDKLNSGLFIQEKIVLSVLGNCPFLNFSVCGGVK